MINQYKGLSLSAAKVIQEQLRKELRFDILDNNKISTIAGADVSFNPKSRKLYGAIVVLSYPEMTLRSYALATGETDFPYVSGYLGFREVPTLLNVWELFVDKPDLVILDGQGILHPRRMGIASHFGALAHSVTIGCVKTSRYGYCEQLQAFRNSSAMVYEEHSLEHIGYVIHTKDGTKPIYVSPGWGLNLVDSLAIVKKCFGKYRIPEPTRIAHQIVNDFRVGKIKRRIIFR